MGTQKSYVVSLLLFDKEKLLNMMLKYNGGKPRAEAEELGRFFQYNMYPDEGTGLLRLHSTYRHDLKIYISDEGRVQMSAAAFAKGLLDLEGQLMPILNFGSMEDTVFCGVFDGHGPYGHVIAKRVMDLLPLKLGSHLESYLSCEEVLKEISLNTADRMTSDSFVQISANGESRVYNKDHDMVQMMLTSIVKAYIFMDKELKMQVDVDCFCSGTTAVTMVKQGQHLVVGNIGDSRAVLAEAARIKRCRGRIFALWDEPGVARLWLPNHNSSGLAMARAFGDFCLKDFGLISVPDVSYRRLTEKDEFVVLATDWIWDVLTNEEVVEIVAKAPTRCTAGRALVEAAVRNWRWKFPTSKVDDCAVVCLFFDSKPDKLSTASFSVDKHISNGLTEPDTTSTSTSGSGTESPELNGVEESTESTHS
ncbi:hypothetical protein Bca101_087094 [Brassica carinata]